MASVHSKISRLGQMFAPMQTLIGFGIATLVKALGGLLVIKLSATLLGPSVFGQLGQLMTLVAVVSSFAAGGINNALVQVLASTDDETTRQRKLGAALKICILSSSILSLALILFRQPLATWLLNDASMSWVFLVLAASLWLVGIQNLQQALLAALHRTRLMVGVNIMGTILGVGVFSLLLIKAGVEGAALGLVLMPAMLGLVALITWASHLPAVWRKPIWTSAPHDMHELFTYSLIMLIATPALPIAQVLVRDLVGGAVGWEHVGYWQGMLKISDVYMQFVGMVLVYYALPRFSAQANLHELNACVRHICTLLLPSLLAGLVLIYLLRDWIVQLLFGEAFTPMRDYFLPQMLGDLVRTCAAVAVYYALSRGNRALIAGYDVCMALSLWLITSLLLPAYGGFSISYAYVAASVITAVFVFLYCWCYKRRWAKMSARSPVVLSVDEAIP